MVRDVADPPSNPPSESDAVDIDAYLHRIGIDLESVGEPDLETLSRLQRAHVTSVPFENLAIIGDPHAGGTPTGPADDEAVAQGPGIDLSIPALFEKVVDRARGGYCFELNGLFATLLDTLGYSVDRVAARVDGGLTVPANHHSIVVTLDQRYVVDVGTGSPILRQPLPLDGTRTEDEIGVEWRVADCDRPDEDHQVEYREPDASDWSTRYVFTHEPRDLSYFHATNDYLQTAPESTFTGDPTIQIATDDGHLKLTRDTLADPLDDDSERAVSGDDWHDVLEAEFGIRLER